MYSWRHLWRICPNATLLPDPEAYSDELDAIDDARRRASTVETSPTDLIPLAEVFRIKNPGPEWEGMVGSVAPTVPIRCPNRMRLAIALNQFYLWQRFAEWHQLVERVSLNAVLADVKLTGKSLFPTDKEIVDLSRFLVVLHPGNPGQPDHYTDPCSGIFKFLETHTQPPATGPLRNVLQDARQGLEAAKAEFIACRWDKRRKPPTRQYDKWFERLDRLIGQDA